MEAVCGSGMDREGSPEKVVIRALIIVAWGVEVDMFVLCEVCDTRNNAVVI